MNEREQAERWNAELSTMEAIVGARLGPDAERRDVRQIATGVLLIATLPPHLFGVAIDMLEHDKQRRAKLGGGS